MTRPGDHTPATPRQEHIMNSDQALSRLIEQAIQDKDIDLVADAMAEKMDLERALDISRTDSWNTWHNQQTGGEAA